MNPHKTILTVVLFSPAILLVVWALVIAAGHGYISKAQMVFFLVALAVCVASAEIVRQHHRRQLRRERERDRSRDRIYGG